MHDQPSVPPSDHEGSAEGTRFGPVLALLTLSAVWDARLSAELKSLGLTTRKYGLLAHIDGSPGISFSELARRSLITVQSVHAAVGALAASGLVEDRTAHAGAASMLRVTEKGAFALAEAQRRLSALDAAFVESAPDLAVALRGLHEAPFGAKLQED